MRAIGEFVHCPLPLGRVEREQLRYSAVRFVLTATFIELPW